MKKKFKIVNWELITSINIKEFKNYNNLELSHEILKDFINSNSLFKDKEFFPKHLVNNYFDLLRLSMKNFIFEQKNLIKKCQYQKEEILNFKNELKEIKNSIPKEIYQCPFCLKKFLKNNFLKKHLLKKHVLIKENDQKIKENNQKIKKIKKKKIEISPDFNHYLNNEMESIVNKLNITLKQEQEQIKIDLKKEINKLYNLIQPK